LEIDGAQIIALGGGTWTIERNRALIHEHHGHTIWLDAPFELCWQRITSQDNSRPLARDKAQTYELYKSRCTLYALAKLRIEVDATSSVERLVVRINESLLSHG